jgi:putative copper export protein
VLSPSLDTVRLFVHILAASVWVGGQLALGGVVGNVRRTAPEATKAVAQGFARAAWPAYAVVMLTGLWNLAEVDLGNTSTAYQVTVFVKVTVAVLSGVAALVHTLGRSKLTLALGGALGLLFGLNAMFLGTLLRTA